MTRPCPRILVLDRLDADLGSQVEFTALVELLGSAAEARGVDLALDQSRLEALPLRPSTIDTINASYDLVVATGEDLLSYDATTASGWGVDVPADLLGAIEVPFGVVAAGYDAPAFTPDLLFDEARDHLAATVNHAASFSVRDRGAAERFGERVGIAPTVTGPLGCAIEPADFTLRSIDPARRPIGVSLQLDGAQRVLPFPFQARFEALVRTVMEALEQLVREDGRQIVFVPHTLNEIDRELARLLQVRMPEGSVVLAHEEVPGLFTPTEIHRAATLAAIYRDLDVVLSHRPASVVMPFVVGTPTVALTATDGAAFLLDSLGAPPHSVVDVRRFDREVRVPRLLSALRAGAAPGATGESQRRVAEARVALAAVASSLIELAADRHAHRAPPMERAASF